MARRDPTSIIPDPLPGRCLRCGCHRPQHPGDDLGLCRFHHSQLTHGTIGHDLDTWSREHDTTEAQHLLDLIREALDLPNDVPLRKLARIAGLPKDLIWHIHRATFTHVRSAAWEALCEALANAIYNSEQQCRSVEACNYDDETHHNMRRTAAWRINKCETLN